MRTINNLLQAVIKTDLPSAVENSLIDTQPVYVDLQQRQMYAGIRSDGEEIQRIGAKYKGYSPVTIRIKEKKGQPTDRVTLKDTGEFYLEIFADARAEGIVVDSADEKSQKLQEAYGAKIFGLDDLSRQAYVEKVRPVFAARLIDQLNKR